MLRNASKSKAYADDDGERIVHNDTTVCVFVRGGRLPSQTKQTEQNNKRTNAKVKT